MKSMVLAILALFAAATAHAQSGFSVAPGDTLTIEVLEDPELNRDVLVLPDGTINFPFAGSVNVGGRSVSDIESSIESAIASNFASRPNVFVRVQQLTPTGRGTAVASSMDVYFLGEFNSPGALALPHGTTFLQALAAGGGLTPFAADKRVQLRRVDRRTGASRVVVINYRALSRGAVLTRDVVLRDGDVILAPTRGLFE